MNSSNFRQSGDGGFTVLELTVALAVFMVALVIILPTYSALSKNATNNQAITTADTGILPPLNQLAADVSNASSMYVPSNNTSSVVLTTATTGGSAQCAQWEVSSSLLEKRTWAPGASPSPTNFSVYPGSSDLAVSTSSHSSLFALSGQANDLLTIDFMVQSGNGSPKREIQSSFAAQGTAQGICTPTPSPSS